MIDLGGNSDADLIARTLNERGLATGSIAMEETVRFVFADGIAKVDPYDFQDLVAAVLRAMGFRAASHAPGMDRGVDIVAHPDAFGFQGPRIKVQVKHRKGSASGPEMREK
jgi:restriction system protein